MKKKKTNLIKWDAHVRIAKPKIVWKLYLEIISLFNNIKNNC